MNIVFLQTQSVFIVGFIIGFVTVLLSEYAGQLFVPLTLDKSYKKIVWNLVEDWSKNSKNYEIWRNNKNIHVSKLDIDKFVYGSRLNENSNRKVVLEAEWLKNEVPVTCVVFVEKFKLVATIKDTWGKQCNNLLFFSQRLNDLNLSIINLGIKFTSSWQLLCEAINYIWKRRDKISVQWLIFIKDDSIVIPENLRYMLAPLDFTEPHYLGHAVVLWGLPYNIAQAGYVLSYESLNRLMKVFDSSEKCAAGGKYWKKEDYYLGKHLASLGIHPSDTRDSKQQGTFHGYSLNALLWGVSKPDHYFTRALYPPGSECCSNRTITFSVGDADKVRTVTYILYQLRIFEMGIFGNKPAPTLMPDNEVWKLALREEFNLTDIDEMTSETYYQVWRSKYSEPELFIAKKFRVKPEKLKSIEET